MRLTMRVVPQIVGSLLSSSLDQTTSNTRCLGLFWNKILDSSERL